MLEHRYISLLVNRLNKQIYVWRMADSVIGDYFDESSLTRLQRSGLTRKANAEKS